MCMYVKAADFAARGHRSQRRKGRSAEPYINHPLEVAWILSDCVKGISEEVLCAAVLHDTIEDCGASSTDLTLAFNAQVSALVEEVSDDKDLPKPEQKRIQLEGVPKLSIGAKMIRLADKISNLSSLMTDPPKDWPEAQLLSYIEFGKAVGRACAGISPDLDARFEQTLAAVETHYGVPSR